MTKFSERESGAGHGVRNAIDTPRIVSSNVTRYGVKDQVDPVESEDPETMGGPIAQDLLPVPRHRVFSVREPRTEPVSQSWQRQDVDEAAWHGSLPMPILIPFGHPPRVLRFSSPFAIRASFHFEAAVLFLVDYRGGIAGNDFFFGSHVLSM